MEKIVQKIGLGVILVVGVFTQDTLYAGELGVSTRGLLTLERVVCRNKTTGEKITVRTPATLAVNCEKAGLKVHTGDKIQLRIGGSAQGLIPDTPDGVNVQSGINKVVISWLAVPGAESYRIYAATIADIKVDPAFLVAEVKSAGFEHFTPDYSVYYYMITAVNGSGESNPTKSLAGIAIDHSSLVNNCASCHNGTTATGKPTNHLQTNADCKRCHNYVWIPAHMDHSAVTRTCSECHQKPAVHILVPPQQECTACHRSTVTWTAIL